MANIEHLRSLVKQLQSSTAPEEIRDVLQTMKKEARVTEAALRESKAGLAVGKLRQNSSKEVADLAKELVKQWKADVERDKAARGGDGAGAGKPKDIAAKKAASKSSTPAPATPTTPTAIKASAPPTPAPRASAAASASAAKKPAAGAASAALGGARTMKADGCRMDPVGDAVRDKCVELLYNSLAIDTAAPADLILKRASAIEAAVLAAHDGATSSKYKDRIRQLYLNLRDPKNPGLREGLVSGDTPAARFAGMTSAEMASAERQAADDKIKADNLFGALSAHEQQAETDAFQCGRCKQRKCRYRQAQTRSADEPMTTFVTCTNCGHRWKFS